MTESEASKISPKNIEMIQNQKFFTLGPKDSTIKKIQDNISDFEKSGRKDSNSTGEFHEDNTGHGSSRRSKKDSKQQHNSCELIQTQNSM